MILAQRGSVATFRADTDNILPPLGNSVRAGLTCAAQLPSGIASVAREVAASSRPGPESLQFEGGRSTGCMNSQTSY